MRKIFYFDVLHFEYTTPTSKKQEKFCWGMALPVWCIYNYKNFKMRDRFQNFFIKLLSWQIITVVALIILSAFEWFDVSDQVIIVFITSVFVETLGAVAIMIKFAFDSTQEVQILKILSGAIRNFQKFKKSE